MNSTVKKYDCLIIDIVNFCYKLFTYKKEKNQVIQVGSKLVYLESIKSAIKSIDSLAEKYLHSGGQVYILFDNYYSRADLKSSFLFADRKSLDEAYKETRKKENREFYNSVNFLKYFYIIGPSKYHTAQITGLEADDLLKPLLTLPQCKDKKCLLVTSDLDWARYLSNNPIIDWLPSLSEDPQSIEDLSQSLGFPVTEDNIELYKAIFGDASDNIDPLIRENPERKAQFIEILKKLNYPEEIILFSRDSDKKKKWSLLEAVSAKERQFLINLQLVSSIPCKPENLKEVLTDGNNSTILYRTVCEAIGLIETEKQFSFGNVRRPRV
jgi:5'-3' exonuclease